MSARLSDEGGFTLVELLVAMVVGMIVIFAALAVMDSSWRLQARTADNLDATDRGRVAMDRITQQLDGRVCLTDIGASAQGSIATATDNQIEFYSSLTSDTAPRLVVERRRLTYRPATQDILLETWRGTLPPPTPPPVVTTTPTRTVVVANGVAPAVDTSVTPPVTTPVFRYFAMSGTPSLPNLLLPTPVATAVDRDSITLVKVSFAAVGKKRGVQTQFHNDSFTRNPICLF